MLVLVSGANPTVQRLSPNPYLGRLTSPRAGNRVGHDGLPWAADNGAFSSTGFDPAAYKRMLERLPSGGLFVVAPDVVADHEATLVLWKEWRPIIVEAGQRPAFVLQDGCDCLPDDTSAIFIGGTTEYKLGLVAAGLTREAKARGMWVHMGRVNSRRRIYYAWSIGVDSCDGTATSRNPEIKIPRYLHWAEAADKQGELFR
jgi:hypothetical protein